MTGKTTAFKIAERIASAIIISLIIQIFCLVSCKAEKRNEILSGSDLSSAISTATFRGNVAHTGAFEEREGAAFGGVRWLTKTGAAVRSSPVVADGALYVGSSDGNLYAYDSESGELRWMFEAGSSIVSTPAFAANVVYFATRDGRLVAVETLSGKPLWTVKAEEPDAPLAWGYESGDFFTSSPTVVGNKIFWGGGDGFLYALDRLSGKRLWNLKTGGRIRSTPAVGADGSVYVGSFDGKLYAAEGETGKLKWVYETEGASLNSADFGYDRRSIQSSPAIWKDTVLVGARDGFLYAVDARAGTLKWRFDHKISWVNSSPAVKDGKVYAGSSDGRFINCVDIETGAEVWRFKTDSLVWSSPAVSENYLYAGDWAGNLYVLNLANGKEAWRFQSGNRILSSPFLRAGNIYFGDDGGRIFALRTDRKIPLKKAVFWDAEYAKGAVLNSHEKIRDYFQANGYEVLDAGKLAAYLQERINDRNPSVIVFAIDYLPKTLGENNKGNSPLKDYLSAGGKAVWLGIPPQMWEKDLQTGQFASMKMNRPVTASLLGVSHLRGNFDNNSAIVTPEGKKWGLDGWRLSNWSADIETVTTALAIDEQGLAAAWVKNYGGAEGTGFVRVPVIEGSNKNPTNLLELKFAAEYFPK